MADSCNCENTHHFFDIAHRPMNIPSVLHSALSTVSKISIKSTLEEVLGAMQAYIYKNMLYDVKDPGTVYCDENLSSIFNIPKFSLPELKKMLLKVILKENLETVRDLSKALQARVLERKSEDTDDEINKKFCMYSNSESCHRDSDKSPEKTAVCIKQTKDSFSSNSSSESDFIDAQVSTIEKMYEVEYDIDSTSDSDNLSIDSASEYNVEILQAALVTTISPAISDDGFWADGSSNEHCESDNEISESEKWKCPRCGLVSEPPRRWCLKCWGWGNRQGWLVERSEGRTRPRRKRKKNSIKQSYFRVKSAKIDVETPPSSSNGSASLTSSHEIKVDFNQNTHEIKSYFNQNDHEIKADFDQNVHEIKSDFDQNANLKICILCCIKPMDATVVHGRIGHQFSCYQCAQRLVTLKKSCPVCRRRIEKVIHQIVVDGLFTSDTSSNSDAIHNEHK